MDQEINIAGTNSTGTTNHIIDYALSYFPLDLSVYNFPPAPQDYTLNVWEYVMYVNVYAINSDTYNYYYIMDEQLSANDQLFDPIPQQLQGNIICTSDPGNLVFGKFEASAYVKQTFIVTIYNVNGNNIVKYTPVPNIPSIPPYLGPPTFTIPTFWVN